MLGQFGFLALRQFLESLFKVSHSSLLLLDLYTGFKIVDKVGLAIYFPVDKLCDLCANQHLFLPVDDFFSKLDHRQEETQVESELL